MTSRSSQPAPANWPPAASRTVLRWITLILVIAVAWLAFKPSGGSDAGLPWDKANHALAFAVLTLVSALGWPRLGLGRLAVIMLLGGIVIELVQGLPVVGRDADGWDVAADMAGVGLGGLGVLLLRTAAGRAHDRVGGRVRE